MKRLFAACLFTLLATPALAGSYWNTSWGQAFDNHPVGLLVFSLLKLTGFLACLRSLVCWHAIVMHKSTLSRWKCLGIFSGGIALFYCHAVIDIFYHTFF